MEDGRFEIHDYVTDEQWKFEITDEQIDKINEVLPETFQYVRGYQYGEGGFYLVEYHQE
jgi:hypothetical protein